MSDRFEQLTKATANGMSRRGVLKLVGGAVVGATAATVLKPFRASAQIECPSGRAACGDRCCPSGLSCIDANTARCACDPGTRIVCGAGCCLKTETCSDPATVTCCCKGTTPCGTSCCKSGVACINKSQSLCGCPTGTTPCGSGANLRCCPAGKACTSEGCAAATQEPGVGPGYAKPCSSGFCENGTCEQGCSSFDGTFCNEFSGCCECESPCVNGECQIQGQFCLPNGCCVFGG